MFRAQCVLMVALFIKLVHSRDVAVAAERDSLFCIHGTKVNGQSLCECTPGYTGVRCEVSLCENYCLHGNCSVTKEGLRECRCDAGYSGTRCDSYACHQYCLNGGTCSLNILVQPVCTCMEYYKGVRCEDFDEEKLDEDIRIILLNDY